MKVNIVMLMKDRQKLTLQTLDTLYRNTDHVHFNLVIVDDDSVHLTDFPNVMVHTFNWTSLTVDRSRSITAMARNLGVYWVEQYFGRGDFLYLSDNDVYFKPGWLKEITDAFKYGEAYGLKMLGGWNHPYHHTNEIANVINSSVQIHTNSALAGASQLMRWETWDKYGPLQHGAPGVCQGEDDTFSQAITKDSGKIGKVWPHVVLNGGVTNSHGQPAPGADLMLNELVVGKKQYADLYWE